ncbi:Protein kinase-like domain [Pseudocohnilembus persalinus]|uniref:non-specific serine/threonine protein kinase n=1 Tax=Pseudocohnilembus persalinus TaxID=266149 RepID=A0A0V0QDI8_PSEPJ|nr:Protein kinase-like domain [Pseudocohnilembus persalinus]|eukprot:KRX00275.1 Protein kinase-like domain [Pseudocohnilembus persalinus]
MQVIQKNCREYKDLDENYTSFNLLKLHLEQIYPDIDVTEFQKLLVQEWKQRKCSKDSQAENGAKKPQKYKNVVINKRWFIHAEKKNLLEVYDYKKKINIGSGGFGSVFKVTLASDPNVIRSIKQIEKYKLENDQEQFVNEIQNLMKLDHPNIIRLYEIFESRSYVYLVQEYCEGGELFDKIIERNNFDEKLAKKVFKQVVQAVNYCHINGIIHGDLKPENILFIDNQEDEIIKIIDFGFSFDKNRKQRICGTGYYMSQELKNHEEDLNCDQWALGIILYVMMTGKPPQKKIVDQNNRSKIIFYVDYEDENLTEGAIEIIKGCLKPSDQRLTSSQLLNSQWLQLQEEDDQQNCQQNDAQLQKQKSDKMKQVLENLNQFTKTNQLQQIIMTHMSVLLREKDILDLHKIFKQLDKNQDGYLSLQELQEGFQNEDVLQDEESKQKIQEVFEKLDLNNSGSIDYSEFIAASLQLQQHFQENQLKYIFNYIDTDKNGKLSLQELKQYIQNQITLVENQDQQQFQQQKEQNEVNQIVSLKDIDGKENNGSNKNNNNDGKQYNKDQNNDQFDIEMEQEQSLSIINNDRDQLTPKNLEHYLDRIMKKIDKNGDGEIDFEEFLQMMQHVETKEFINKFESQQQNSLSQFLLSQN